MSTENAIRALSAAMTVTSVPAEGVNMNQCFDRRSMLALSAAGILAAALPGCTSPSSAPSQESYELTDYGYDASVPEAVPMDRPRRLDKVPPNASVRAEWLPPVGDQHMPNCFVWASVYGLATFYAARKSKTPPTTPDWQASPDYAYIRYQTSIKMARNTCRGGQVSKVLDWLKANGGTPSLAAAPNFGKQGSQSSCDVNWTKYGSQPIPPDPKFLIPEWKATTITGKEGLENMRTVIARGNPIAFGVNLYTDFPHYRGKRSPYVGSGKFMENQGKKVGHVMLIVAYDNDFFGTGWGDEGFVWMSYRTFEAISQGQGFYVPDDV
ncbi:MAG TPA: C1 family peptidase [Mycobacterium sp.]|nr:C1 family peptidase [Mycobacterium sp.]